MDHFRRYILLSQLFDIIQLFATFNNEVFLFKKVIIGKLDVAYPT